MIMVQGGVFPAMKKDETEAESAVRDVRGVRTGIPECGNRE